MAREMELKQSKACYSHCNLTCDILVFSRVGYNVKKKLQGMDVYKVLETFSKIMCCAELT